MTYSTGCELCNHPATSLIQWGKVTTQKGHFCSTHSEDLWDKCRAGVTAGLLFWIQMPLDSIEKEDE